jgi:hypothetical protein
VRHKLEYLFTVRIQPGYFNEHNSRYYVNLKTIREGGLFGNDHTILDKNLLLPASEAHKVRTLQGEEHLVLIHRFSGKELGLPDNFHEDKYIYTLSAKLDFYGDGSSMLFDVMNKGAIEIRGTDA